MSLLADHANVHFHHYCRKGLGSVEAEMHYDSGRLVPASRVPAERFVVPIGETFPVSLPVGAFIAVLAFVAVVRIPVTTVAGQIGHPMLPVVLPPLLVAVAIALRQTHAPGVFAGTFIPTITIVLVVQILAVPALGSQGVLALPARLTVPPIPVVVRVDCRSDEERCQGQQKQMRQTKIPV
jgi:hypothetical protein